MRKINAIFLTIILLISNNGIANAEIGAKNAVVTAPIPGMLNTAGYVTLMNQSDSDITLTSADSIIADKVEFHDHIMTHGVMKMVKLEQIVVPANGSLIFQSGGLHIMFLGVSKHAAHQEKTEVTLYAASGEKYKVSFNIKSIKQQHHHHH